MFEFMIRSISITVFLLCAILASMPSCKRGDRTGNGHHGALYARLDSVLGRMEEEREISLSRIDWMCGEAKFLRDEDELYAAQQSIAEAYTFVDRDSALSYMARNIALARRMSRPDHIGECMLRRAFILSVWGCHDEGLRELNRAGEFMLFDDLRLRHDFLYIYISDRAGMRKIDGVARCAELMRTMLAGSENDMALWSRCFGMLDAVGRRELRNELEARIAELRSGDIWLGLLSYEAALLAHEDGQEAVAAEYMAEALCSDYASLRMFADGLPFIARLAAEEGEEFYADRFMKSYSLLCDNSDNQ